MRRIRSATIVSIVLGFGHGIAAESRGYVTTKNVVYTGETLAAENLTTVDAPAVENAARQLGVADIVGKRARRTLVPGNRIQPGDLDDALIVSIGAQIRFVLQVGGLRLETQGQALENGVVNDIVRVRNVDTGRTIVGRVQSDGTIRAGDDR